MWDPGWKEEIRRLAFWGTNESGEIIQQPDLLILEKMLIRDSRNKIEGLEWQCFFKRIAVRKQN